jgi:hypothetical protein
MDAMDKFAQAKEYLQAGDKARAKQLLVEIVQAEPRNEQAWLWMSAALDDPGQQRYCLEQVLKIDPANQQAAAALLKLKGPGSEPAGLVREASPAAQPVGQADSRPDAHPVPDISDWPRDFTGWGIWPELRDSASHAPRETGLGLLILESGFAATRSVIWTVVFVLAAVLVIVIALTSPTDPAGLMVFAGFSLLFWGLAIFRIVNWYMNHDLSLRVYREGFAFTRGGNTETVFWREIERVREEWTKEVYQGVIHIYFHKIEIHKTNGQRLKLDRKITDIEQVGRIIQQAVADQLLAGTVERLRSGEMCDFGAFSISRERIAHKGKKSIPWSEVKSLGINTIGRTTFYVYKTDGKLGLPWAMETGGSLFNLHLFTVLTNWFIEAARQPEAANRKQPFDGTVNYQMSVTKQEARLGAQKVLFVGTPRQERRLVVQVPAGTKSDAVQRFPGFGMPDSQGRAAGDLNIILLVGKSPDPAGREATQITIGAVILILGMLWLSLWSTLDVISSTLLAAVIGAVGGLIAAVNHRLLGAVCGAIGGVVSFALQALYYIFMYLAFGREEFWDLETAIVMIVSFAPGVGLYWLLTRKRDRPAAHTG